MARRRTNGAVLGRGWHDLPEEYDPIPADIEGAMRSLGIEITDVDLAEVKGHCPGHPIFTGKKDRNPSWSVNLTNGTHHCFSCGYEGSFVGLTYDVMSGFGEKADVEWRHARLWVIEQGVDLEQALNLPDDFRASRESDRVRMEVFSEEALRPFGEPPDEELESRQLSLKAAKVYGCRFSRTKREWILPIRDPKTGDLWGWQTKPVNKARHPMNVPGEVKKSRTLFGIDRMPKGCVPVLVESPLDCPRIWMVFQGVGYWGVSSYGAGVSEEQMRLIRSVSDEAIVALDNDADGKKHSERIQESWGGRLNLSFFNYVDLAEYRKDPGDATDGEVRAGVLGAIHSTLYVAV